MKVPTHERLTLDNGVRIILVRRDDVPLIAFEALMRGGARSGPAGPAGVASITAELLTRGAGNRDAYAFADAVEGAGGSLDAEARAETLLVHGQFLARDRELMLELLADALMRPRFEQTEFDNLRARRIELIKAAKDSEPQSLIGDYGRALLFDGHPYAEPVVGSEASLEQLGRQDILQFYRQQCGADRLTLVFAGDFAPQLMKSAIARAFAPWARAAMLLPPLAAAPRRVGRRVWLIDAPRSAQTYFWIGNVGVARDYPQRAAADVVNTAFGGSFSSMLMQALRSKSGLTYSVGSYFNRGTVPGEFAINSFAQTASTRRALDVALATLTKLHAQGLGPSAIASARNYMLGQYPLAFETAADWAATLGDLDLYGLDEAYINEYAPALQEVDQSAAERVIGEAFPTADDVDIVLIGDAAKIRGVAQSLGRVIETPLQAPDYRLPVQ